MRRFLPLLAALALTPTPARAQVDPYYWGTWTLARGYEGALTLTVLTAENTPRDVTNCTGLLVVFKKEPVNGVGPELFRCTLDPTGRIPGELGCTVTDPALATAGTFWGELRIAEGATRTTGHGWINITGK